MATTQSYTVGPSRWRLVPRVRTKPSTVTGERIDSDGERHLRRDSGGGYERIRSTEYRPRTARDGSEDVYVAHHRLLAVVACYPSDMPVGEILDHLHGKDVHHRSGVEWDNRPGNLAVREHATHSEITQAQMRAWAEDDKRRVATDQPTHDADRCDSCGDVADVLARSEDWSGDYCLDCGKRASDGSPIEVV